jgi:hypothetical protein
VEQKQFGRYIIVAELGRGAMGAVHRAVDPLIERDVAIKTLLPTLPPEVMAEVRERFLREARSAGRLNHPNIVTIYDVGEQEGVAYIAMELLEGRSLQQVIRDGEKLPVERIADLIAQVAEGLDHAQDYKITHRDIKPANIMVSAAGRAKLTDFGVAHVASSSMTQTGSAIGSPKYMSPEQVTGQPVDPRADIFSLGVVLYELLVGRTPFEKQGDNQVFALMHRIAGEPHQAVTKIDSKIPAAFDVILDVALAKSPDKRYQRAGDMARDLRNFKALARPTGAGAEADRTVVLARAAQGAAARSDKTVALSPGGGGAAPRTEETSTQLLADLDSFTKSFEERQSAQLRAEEEARLRKEEELRRWAEAEEKRREEFERERDAKAGGERAAARKSSALEMLKQKAATRTVSAADESAKRAEVASQVDSRMRAAFHYLSEFASTLNEAHPVSEKKQGVMYFGEVAGMTLGDGFTDYRTRHLNGKDRVDFITFRYKVRFPRPMKLEVPAQQLQRVRERLTAMSIKFDYAEQKNDFGQPLKGVFTMTGPFPCQAILRADYDNPGVAFEMINIRRHGEARTRLKLEEFTDAVLDEFGTYVLGADDAFERFLKRR